MIISYKWIASALKLTGLKYERVSAALNNLGFEVNTTTILKNKGLKLVKITHLKKVANTKNLTYCTIVDTFNKNYNVICGANNLKINAYAIYGPVNSTIANGTKLGAKQIKGYESLGMLCSLSELGINEDNIDDENKDGIFLLKESCGRRLWNNPQIQIKDIFNDCLYDIDLTFNRSDAFAISQILRELSVYFGIQFFEPKIYKEKNNVITTNFLKLTKSEISQCEISVFGVNFRNYAISFEDSISMLHMGYKIDNSDTINILAIQVALETGHIIIPIDSTLIKDKLLITKFEINNKSNLVIKDNDKIIYIFGDALCSNKYKPSKSTKNILLIGIKPDFQLMRKLLKQNNINSIISDRLVKPISLATLKYAMDRLLYLINFKAIINSTVSKKELINNIKPQQSINVDFTKISKLLGFKLSDEKIIKILKNLNFIVNKKSDQVINVTSNDNRLDIETEADIAEEIIRIYGYDKIVSKPYKINHSNFIPSKKNEVANFINNLLSSTGFFEVKSYNLVSEDYHNKYNFFEYKNHYKILYPLSDQHVYMQKSNIFNLWDIYKNNSYHQQKNIKIFELKNILSSDKNQYHLSVLGEGTIINDFYNSSFIKMSYSYMQQILLDIVNFFNLNNNDLIYKTENKIKYFHPNRTAKVYIDNQLIAILGEFDPKFSKQNKINVPSFLELNISNLIKFAKNRSKFKKISKFNSLFRDITFNLENNDYQKLILIIQKKKVKHLTNFSIIDCYKLEDKNLNKLTLRFEFNDDNSPVKDQIVKKEIDDLIKLLKLKKITID